jgi:phospholipid transport system substrate-binding protein
MVIKTTLSKITAFGSTATTANPKQLRAFISREITPHFDFNNMAHWITGRYAKNMSPQDKINFKRSLREAFLSSLAKHLGSFDVSQTRFQISPAFYRGRDEAFVNTRAYRPYMPTVKLYFRMRFDGTAWRIIDVKANGFSAVLYYRQFFIQQLRQYKANNLAPVFGSSN